MKGKARSTSFGENREVAASPLVNSKNHGRASNPRIDALILDSLPAIVWFTKGHPYNLYGLVAWLRNLT